MMPSQSIWMIRLSLIWLFVSAVIGGLLLVHKAVGLHPALWSLLPVHFELAIWGWLVQFLLGTAYWMFPRKLVGARRGPAFPAWMMVALLNTGLLFLVTAAMHTDGVLFAITGRSLIATSILLFFGLIRPRIVTYRNR
ncbi:MAG: hypothetical protein ACNA78_09390 [Balneolaceae bacterium]